MSNVFVYYLLFSDDKVFSFEVLQVLIDMWLEFPGPMTFEPKTEKDENSRDIPSIFTQDDSSVDYFFRKFNGGAHSHLIRQKYAERWAP